MSYQPFERCTHTHECMLDEEFFLPDIDLKHGLEIATRILNGQQESQQDLLHLLHIYILPIIRLHADDKDHVSMALKNQKEVLQKLDSKLDKMTKQRGNIKAVMRHWRSDICGMLQSVSDDDMDKDIVGCNRDFLKVLCQHLEEDIKNAYVQLDVCQQAVDLAKIKVEQKLGPNYITELTRVRKIRDEVAEYITKALYVVEEVSLMADGVRRPTSVAMSDMQVGYIKINKEWEEHTNELRELQRRKVCATSVREALVTTESELENTTETFGMEILSSGTTKATDILDPHALPKEWEQLQTHVNEALETQEHLRNPHREFCHYLRSSCADEIAEISKTNSCRDRGPSFSQTTKLLIEHRLKPSPEALRSLRASLKERKPATHFQEMTKMLLNETQEHFTKMVDMMEKDYSVPCTCRARLWTCYERCIFPNINVDIMKVYKEAYKAEIRQLEGYLPVVSITELGLDDEWILNILGLYAPSSLTQAFMLDSDEASGDRNSCDDTPTDLTNCNSDRQYDNCVANSFERDGVDLANHHPADCQGNIKDISSSCCSQPAEASQNSSHKISATCQSRTNAIVDCDCKDSKDNPHYTKSHSNSPEQTINNLERFHQLLKDDNIERPDLESSIKSESAIVGSIVERRICNNTSHQSKSGSCQSEQTDNLDRCQQLLLKDDNDYTERPDLESSIKSESAVVGYNVERRRKPKRNIVAQRSWRQTQVMGHKWVTPVDRSQFTAPDRLKKRDKIDIKPASLPSMLEAEVRMSSVIGPVSLPVDIIGPASLPIDIPVQRVSALSAVADSGVCFESLPNGDLPAFQTVTENTNNSRHNNEESLNPCDISIVVTPSTTSNSELSKRRKDPQVAAFLERFRTAYYCLRVVLQESIPTSKFQWLCKCLKEVNNVAEKQAQLIFFGKRRLLCGDDLLTTLILFVLHGDPDEMAQAYPQLKFMENYLPEFLDKGQFGFSVYQFLFAFQYIMDKNEAMKRMNAECKGL